MSGKVPSIADLGPRFFAFVESLERPVVFFDLETTGLDADAGDEIIEVGAVPILDGEIREDCAFQSLIDPDRPIPPDSTRVHGITEEMVKGKPRVEVVLPEFLRFCGPHPLVAQNADFDMNFLRAACDLNATTPDTHLRQPFASAVSSMRRSARSIIASASARASAVRLCAKTTDCHAPYPAASCAFWNRSTVFCISITAWAF